MTCEPSDDARLILFWRNGERLKRTQQAIPWKPRFPRKPAVACFSFLRDTRSENDKFPFRLRLRAQARRLSSSIVTGSRLRTGGFEGTNLSGAGSSETPPNNSAIWLRQPSSAFSSDSSESVLSKSVRTPLLWRLRSLREASWAGSCQSCHSPTTPCINLRDWASRPTSGSVPAKSSARERTFLIRLRKSWRQSASSFGNSATASASILKMPENDEA